MSFTHPRFRAPWLSSLQAYEYMSGLARSDWAWEFLRRNPAFWSLARLRHTRGVVHVRLASGAILTRLRARQPNAEAWGLAAFTDPRLDAFHAHPVWIPEFARRPTFQLTARTTPKSADGIDIRALPSVEHILLDAAGRQHVTLRGVHGRVWITIVGAPVVPAPITLCLSLGHADDIVQKAGQLWRLGQALSASNKLPDLTTHRSAHSKRLRDALITLDGRRAGATFRQIASLIYGPERVERDWPGAGLKVRIRRDFQRGLALCNGGYRDLLVQG
ncbi:MAG: DUF2285 domain-containing protein [Hyphomicrobiales bacterium]|nr:MAG: DUF2285 domain-containing protein [Hyphomicrobiales bacterium]